LFFVIIVVFVLVSGYFSVSSGRRRRFWIFSGEKGSRERPGDPELG